MLAHVILVSAQVLWVLTLDFGLQARTWQLTISPKGKASPVFQNDLMFMLNIPVLVLGFGAVHRSQRVGQKVMSLRDFVPFSSINHMTLLAWAMGRGKGHTGILNAQRVHKGLKKCHVSYGQSLKSNDSKGLCLNHVIWVSAISSNPSFISSFWDFIDLDLCLTVQKNNYQFQLSTLPGLDW